MKGIVEIGGREVECEVEIGNGWRTCTFTMPVDLPCGLYSPMIKEIDGRPAKGFLMKYEVSG